MKISILLPYKENFSPNYAGAVSLFVKDTTNHSAYKKDTHIFGNMEYTKSLLDNYINLDLNKKFYKSRLNKDPNISITGLNPHCESNYNSSEEDKIIKPTIKSLNKNKAKIKGPLAADTVFLKSKLDKIDVIIGMYHDQVLTPMKAIFGFDAINITLGLPFIRISPDHGPNVDRLGKNLSNPESLVQAIKFLDK